MSDPAPPTADAPFPVRPAVLRIITPLLLLFGVQVWLTAGRGYWRWLEPQILAVLLVVCLLPPIARHAAVALDRLRRPSRLVAIGTAIGLTITSTAYLTYDAVRDGRPLAPRYQDEYSYLIQTQHVAQGRLWMPPHPLPEFFESYQLITTPVYASVYFPGASMMFAPGVWLGLPGWLMPVLCAGVTVGATYLIVTFLLDGVAGLLAALFLLALPVFRLMAIKPMAQVPELLLCLLAIGSYLLWRHGHRRRYAILTGAFLGWAAITRPIDAVCVGLPIGVALLMDLRNVPRGQALRTLATVTAAAVPFLAIQAIFNIGVTGHVLHTPYNYYVARDLPGAEYGFRPYDPQARPASPLLQKAEFFESNRSLIAAHTPDQAIRHWVDARLPAMLRNCTPHPMLMVLIPVGVLGLFSHRRWVLSAMAPAYLLVYYFHVFFLPHYDLLAAPAVALMVLAAIPTLAAAYPRLRQPITLFLTAGVAVLVVGQFREFNRHVLADPYVTTQQNRIDRLLAELPGRAIVLFRYNPGGIAEQEPVYNVDVPWPDDARVIRAHDLGDDRNRRLFHYYSGGQPDRDVYRYDRGDDTLSRLGNVRDLASAAVAPIISSPN